MVKTDKEKKEEELKRKTIFGAIIVVVVVILISTSEPKNKTTNPITGSTNAQRGTMAGSWADPNRFHKYYITRIGDTWLYADNQATETPVTFSVAGNKLSGVVQGLPTVFIYDGKTDMLMRVSTIGSTVTNEILHRMS